MLLKQDYLDYLKLALPESDRIMLKDQQLEEIVGHEMHVRSQVGWGELIPEDIFKAYVLFPRVNNEFPSAYHQPLWEALRGRVLGMRMLEAVLEVNYWCAEEASYRSTDGRTNGPLDMLRLSWGRCGEESTLLVSALRACCIPARQVYVPRWSHCDDNHAWVEAWVDGSWHYMGACEPEPVLDSGWFTAAASRAMLVHTKAWGILPAGDEPAGKLDTAWIINRTAAYARTARVCIRVTENGCPKAGLTVRFEIANMAEFLPINEQETDANGCVRLTMGLGTVRIHGTDGEKWLCRMLRISEDIQVSLDWREAASTISEEEFEQYPPEETRIQPTELSEALVVEHQRQLRNCAALLAGKRAAFPQEKPYLKLACGNAPTIRAFLKNVPGDTQDKTALLDTLREKDFGDATLDMLEDALQSAFPYKEKYLPEVWRRGVLAPRVANEKLLPVRRDIRAWFGKDTPETPMAVWEKLKGSIQIHQGKDICCPDLAAVLRGGACGANTLDILFVACARALGFGARLSRERGIKEVWAEGGWCALLPDRAAKGTLRLVNTSGKTLNYGTHFTIGALEQGVFSSLDLEGCTLADGLEIQLPVGSYRLMTCTRLPNGAVEGNTAPFTVAENKAITVEVSPRPYHVPNDLQPVSLCEITVKENGEQVRLLASAQGKAGVYVLLSPADEPSEHFLNELNDAVGAFRESGITLRLMVERGTSAAGLERVKQVLAAFDDARLFELSDARELVPWRKALKAGELRLPFAAAVNEEGKGLFACVNYHVGSVQVLLDILNRE